MARRAMMLTVLALLQGCVGGWVISNPQTDYAVDSVALRGKGYLASSMEASNWHLDEVLRVWGAPDRRRDEGRRTVLYYRSGLAWSGVVPWVLIPIPVVVPVGTNQAVLVFEDERLVSASAEDRDGAGGLCGLFMNDSDSSLTPMCVSL